MVSILINFNDFHFGLWYNYKNRPWTLKIWLGTLWRITAG